MRCNLLQIGSHIGNTVNDNVFNVIDSDYFAIFVEPIKEYFDSLVENYNQTYPNNNFVFINKACSNETKKIKLYKPIHKNGLPNWTNQLTSILPNHTKNHNIDTQVEEIEVEAIKVSDIINEYNISEIDLLSVDTEGHDYEIIKSIDFELIKPKKIIFEHKHMEGTNKSFGPRYFDLINYLNSKGYIVIKQEGDDTFMTLNK
jgi:FkbM family methyltransferase